MYSQGELRYHEEFKGCRRIPLLVECQSLEELCDYTWGSNISYTMLFYLTAFIDVYLGLSISLVLEPGLQKGYDMTSNIM